ncbi:MAG TPA: LacI family DNA-binding transcriptional regulator [Streptosporangiaceae bacterium]|nr:LacI family DNA-binding transcriptional regulator [Streptosporangiaceae bacterium]
MTSQQGGSQQPPGIRDVARIAGVSVATVSLALNSQPGVAEHTRRRILAAAAELGYRANPQAQALRRGRTTTYGLVIRNFGNPFFLEVLRGAEQAASQAGATLLLLDSHYSAERERALVQEMAVQRLAGLAIAPVGRGESVRLWQELRPGTPVVALNASAEGLTGVSRVYPDNATGVELAMRRLAELGHSRVAFLSAPRGLVADPDRLRHFRRLARVLGIRPDVMHTPLTITDVRKAAGTLLARRDASTAIITNSDYTALGIYQTARDLSLRIGPDVSVIGHDDLPTSELLDPPLATIRLDGREMGRALIARLVEGNAPSDYIAPVQLVERASLQTPDGPAQPGPAPLRAATR